MTTNEAKELYLASDCSYFAMCTYHYSSYLQYRQLGVPKIQEDIWKEEKLRNLQIEIQKTGDCRIFDRLYEIAVEFRDYKRLRMMLEAFKQVNQPLNVSERVALAETILGKRLPKARSGLIYWAYDIGQKSIAILLMEQVLQYLEIPNVTNIELCRRIQKGKRLCKKLNMELKLNFYEQELQCYSPGNLQEEKWYFL